jgi:hypothetical protein
MMRGRAMSLNTLLIMCVRPLGDFPAGAVIGWLGFREAVLISAGLVGTAVLAISGFHIRHRDRQTQRVGRDRRTVMRRNGDGV